MAVCRIEHFCFCLNAWKWRFCFVAVSQAAVHAACALLFPSGCHGPVLQPWCVPVCVDAARADPGHTGMARNGLDVVNCGAPSNRTWRDPSSEDGAQLTFQFKSYAVSPPVDPLFLYQVSALGRYSVFQFVCHLPTVAAVA